ncbi:hypothetical protein VDGD_05429 [Verticillium dahliae]|nr:hypothetical protein VDGD_05429 [Verticillium dahliae]
MRHVLVASLAAVAAASSLAVASDQPLDTRQQRSLSWALTPTNSTAQFRGLAAVSDTTAWVSGTRGTVLRTVDGGATWTSVGPRLAPEDAALQFRDVQAFSATKAVILSIGEGTDSRIYVTEDGGTSWDLVFTNEEPTAFYNCVDFEDQERGLAVSDPVDGKFRLVETKDGGRSWGIVDASGMAPALAGEFGFSASGTCITTAAGRWYLAAGGVDPGRVFRSDDGYDWDASNASITGSEAGGVFSVRFRDTKNGVAVGGDFTVPEGAVRNAAWSEDGGQTWTAAETFPRGYRSATAWVGGLCNVAVAVGPTGSDVTVDGGRTWTGFDGGAFDSVECVGKNVCWASGPSGRVARLVIG